MQNVVITYNLVNDFCSPSEEFQKNNIHIGSRKSEILFGSQDNWGNGPLPNFLRVVRKDKHSLLIHLRDSYDPNNNKHAESLEILGNHCIQNSTGIDYLSILQDKVANELMLDCIGQQVPIIELNNIFNKVLNRDLFNDNVALDNEVRILLIGFQTEKQIYSLANFFTKIIGLNHIAVFQHFLASSNNDLHFAALRHDYPDNFIRVINNLPSLSNFLELDLSSIDDTDLKPVNILPVKYRKLLNQDQKSIVESLCMHWTEATIKPLGGGFSGSLLFIASGKQKSSKTEPMVIKVDYNQPIRNEVNGYHMVKDFLGKHVPAFTLPVSKKQYSGVGMELAAMEGTPNTLQYFFESSIDDFSFEKFMRLLKKILLLLSDKIYDNTLQKKKLAPFRHHSLHIKLQQDWFSANIDNISNYYTNDTIFMKDVLVSMFNVIRKNSDALSADSCICHGDLNLANIIVDDTENIWAIDWTHTAIHPVEMDFAKLENDIKFILSKNFELSDLPNLKMMEDYMLENRTFNSIESLPKQLNFIRWDLRFKKIFLAVNHIRESYFKLTKNNDWVIYKISLLRFVLHSLSFDKNLGNGECTPPMLLYALTSTEALLFQLVADDYHLTIRSERPENYPERLRLQIDNANWNVVLENYNPPYFVTDNILNLVKSKSKNGYADPENEWVFDKIVNWGRKFNQDKEQKPLNPSGRTGIAGRGDLAYWGSNPMVFILPIKFNKASHELQILLGSDTELSEIINVHIRRGETESKALKRCKEKVGYSTKGIKIFEIFTGYIYDPRQTDNAWVEGKAHILFLDDNNIDLNNISSWSSLDDELINKLYSTSSFLLRKGLKFLVDENIVMDKIITPILEKSGS